MTYDPFIRGRLPVGVRTVQALDAARDRLFPCEIWYPASEEKRDVAAQPGPWPLILFSHHSGGHRRAATFLTSHLSSHGYVVAALDHSEVVVKELARREGEPPGQLAARMEAVVASRVPDLRLLLDHVLSSAQDHADPDRIGIVGHSLGGWTVLATPDVEPRVRAVVALAPGGNSNPKPGIVRAKLPFAWGRDVPALYLVAENDVCLPLDGMYEIFARTPGTKQMLILRRADHMHFMDNVEEIHESARNTPFSGDLAWISTEMRPITELCSGEEAHLFVRGLTLCHMDAVLRHQEEAQRFLAGDVVSQLAKRRVEAMAHV
jgi:predicted dienelactone hydrolase